jgi:beta-galactosidase
LRWDEVKYEPGELKAVAYKNGSKWAEDIVKTTSEPFAPKAAADRAVIKKDGLDLSFITVCVADKNGLTVPNAANPIQFSITGPGEIVATDNGDPTDLVPFPAHERKAFGGLALVIIRSVPGKSGSIIVTAESAGLGQDQVVIKSQ